MACLFLLSVVIASQFIAPLNPVTPVYANTVLGINNTGTWGFTSYQASNPNATLVKVTKGDLLIAFFLYDSTLSNVLFGNVSGTYLMSNSCPNIHSIDGSEYTLAIYYAYANTNGSVLVQGTLADVSYYSVDAAEINGSSAAYPYSYAGAVYETEPISTNPLSPTLLWWAGSTEIPDNSIVVSAFAFERYNGTTYDEFTINELYPLTSNEFSSAGGVSMSYAVIPYTGTYGFGLSAWGNDPSEYTNWIMAQVMITVLTGAPVLTLSVSPMSGVIGQEFLFALSYNGSKIVYSETLFFGDGNSAGAFGWNPSPDSFNYAYSANGTYIAYAYLNFTDGTSIVSESLTITIGAGGAPSTYGNLALSVSPTSGSQSTLFVFSQNDTGDARISSLTWVFGDQGRIYTDINTPSVQYYYSTNGYFEAFIDIGFANGTTVLSNIVFVTVAPNLGGGNCTYGNLALSVSPTNGTQATQFTFNQNDTGDVCVASLTWAFGDGNRVMSGINTPSIPYYYLSDGRFPAHIDIGLMNGTTLASNIVYVQVGINTGGNGTTSGILGSTLSTLGTSEQWLVAVCILVASIVVLFLLVGKWVPGIALMLCGLLVGDAVVYSLFGSDMLAFEVLVFILIAIIGIGIAVSQLPAPSGGGQGAPNEPPAPSSGDA